MAARLNPRNQDAIRQRIKAEQLVKLLQDHALGEKQKAGQVTATRLDSAKFLLSKVLSNPPQQIEHAGEVTLQWEK